MMPTDRSIDELEKAAHHAVAQFNTSAAKGHSPEKFRAARASITALADKGRALEAELEASRKDYCTETQRRAAAECELAEERQRLAMTSAEVDKWSGMYAEERKLRAGSATKEDDADAVDRADA